MQRDRFFQMVKAALKKCGFTGEVRFSWDIGRQAEWTGWVGKPSADEDLDCEIRISARPPATDDGDVRR